MCKYCEKNKVLKSCNFAGSGEIRIYYKGFEKGIGMLELQGDGMKAKIFKHLYCPRFDILYCPMCRKEAGRVIHITLKEMLEEIVQCILEQKEIKDYYWKDGEGEFRRITEIDLLDRIRTSNDDFTEFEWELEESRLYKVQYGRRSLMTNEQREAIETMQHWIEYEKKHKDEINKADELIHIQDTVLSLIKEQEEEIEKKDKIIDLMTERINWLCKTNGILLDREHGVNFTEEDIKQYFERKVEDETK